jgi:hypothetical protein
LILDVFTFELFSCLRHPELVGCKFSPIHSMYQVSLSLHFSFHHAFHFDLIASGKKEIPLRAFDFPPRFEKRGAISTKGREVATHIHKVCHGIWSAKLF